jgi:acyl carrier protein
MEREVVDRVIDIISKRILGNGSHRPVDVNTRLLSSGLTLDSIAVLELIMELESEFGIEFGEQDLTVELLESVGSLADAVARKVAMV